MWMVRLFPVVGFFVFLGGCALPHKSDPTTLRVALEAEPQTLDPRRAADAYSAKVNQLLYRGLFTTNKALELVPDLLERYERLSDTHFRFILRRDLHFADGSPVTARDVAYTYDWVREAKNGSPGRAGLANIAAMRVVDERTIEIRLHVPEAPFLNRLTLGIVPEHLGDAPDFAEHPIGAGSFRFAEWRRGEFLRLSRVDTDHPALEPTASLNLEFLFLGNENLRILELLHGRVDLVQNGISPAFFPLLEENPNIRVETAPGINVAYLGFNLRDFRLAKPEVRRAIALAIDRNSLIQRILKGAARPALSLLAPENWAAASLHEEGAYDPDKARRILDAAGFPDPDGEGPLPRFRVSYKTSIQQDRIEMAMFIAEFLRVVGIQVDVESREWGTFYRDVQNGRFDLFSLTWVGLVDPDAFYYIFHSKSLPPNGANRGAYRNAEVDKLLESARAIYDQKARKELYVRAQALLAADSPYALLWFEDNGVIRRKDVCGYKLRPDASLVALVEVYRGQCE